ncbi:MAG: diacylglycerol kinase family protein [bacterium]|nr:diacylglycerol kinase family protein [bacterium]
MIPDPPQAPTLCGMERILLCANPSASGFTGGLRRAVVARLRQAFEVQTELPETAAAARAASAAAAARGFDLVVAMGGDGVVHHVANGIGGTSTPMGIIPAGSTNVLARLAGIPGKPLRAADFICSRPAPRTAPAARLTLDYGEGRVESRVATFSFGVGFDAAVVQRAEQEPYRKYSLASVHYAISAAAVAWGEYAAKRPELKVELPGRSANAVAVFVRVYESYTYFGPIPVGFGPSNSDMLTVLMARSFGRRQIPSVLWRAVSGRDLARIKGFEVRAGVPTFDMVAPPGGILAQADGELIGAPEKVSVAAHPDHLRLLAPV